MTSGARAALLWGSLLWLGVSLVVGPVFGRMLKRNAERYPEVRERPEP